MAQNKRACKSTRRSVPDSEELEGSAKRQCVHRTNLDGQEVPSVDNRVATRKQVTANDTQTMRERRKGRPWTKEVRSNIKDRKVTVPLEATVMATTVNPFHGSEAFNYTLFPPLQTAKEDPGMQDSPRPGAGQMFLRPSRETPIPEGQNIVKFALEHLQNVYSLHRGANNDKKEQQDMDSLLALLHSTDSWNAFVDAMHYFGVCADWNEGAGAWEKLTVDDEVTKVYEALCDSYEEKGVNPQVMKKLPIQLASALANEMPDPEARAAIDACLNMVISTVKEIRVKAQGGGSWHLYQANNNYKIAHMYLLWGLSPDQVRYVHEGANPDGNEAVKEDCNTAFEGVSQQLRTAISLTPECTNYAKYMKDRTTDLSDPHNTCLMPSKYKKIDNGIVAQEPMHQGQRDHLNRIRNSDPNDRIKESLSEDFPCPFNRIILPIEITGRKKESDSKRLEKISLPMAVSLLFAPVAFGMDLTLTTCTFLVAYRDKSYMRNRSEVRNLNNKPSQSTNEKASPELSMIERTSLAEKWIAIGRDMILMTMLGDQFEKTAEKACRDIRATRITPYAINIDGSSGRKPLESFVKEHTLSATGRSKFWDLRNCRPCREYFIESLQDLISLGDHCRSTRNDDVPYTKPAFGDGSE